MITALNLAGHELVGLQGRVTSSACTSLIGLNGAIIGETKSMLEIGTMAGPKMVPKSGTHFEVWPVEGTSVSLDGKQISGRPHSRTVSKI